MRRLLARRPLRYLLVGGWNTLFGIGLFTVLWLAAGDALGYAAVLAIAQVIAILQSHATQRLLVWRTRGAYAGELGRFSVVYIASYGLNVALLAAAVDGLGLPVLPVQWALTAILLVPVYFTQRRWAFRPADAVAPR
ncbi:MAG TPA: GtrA family protein [Gaiellaceae bacterium]|nr:GtrA family protein [Gaiellaceae bacterium]